MYMETAASPSASEGEDGSFPETSSPVAAAAATADSDSSPTAPTCGSGAGATDCGVDPVAGLRSCSTSSFLRYGLDFSTSITAGIDIARWLFRMISRVSRMAALATITTLESGTEGFSSSGSRSRGLRLSGEMKYPERHEEF